MITTLSLPKLSATMEEAKILSWIKKEGDDVEEGDVLYELETDKATIEVESTSSGVLGTVFVQEGESAPVGAAVCEIIDSSADLAATEIREPQKLEPQKLQKLPDSPDVTKPLTLRVSPSARRMARELHVDLATVQGTGPKGRIRNRDVEEAVARAAAIPANPDSASVSGDTGSVSKMRMAIAKELVRSTQTIPTFWVEKWVNVHQLLKWKDLLKNSRDRIFSNLTVTDFVLQAMGLALEEIPNMNRRWVEKPSGQIWIESIAGSHVGLAISVDGGIVSPVIANVGSLSLGELVKKRNETVETIRSNKPYVTKESAAITLSNLGSTGIDRFRAIVKPDESMILALGGIQEKPAVKDGQIVAEQGFTMVLSADHRVLDGMDAAKYLSLTARIIETGNWKLT